MSDRVLDAAIEQLCVVGPDALTMEAVASRARVSVGLLYRRYGGLEVLLREALASALSLRVDEVPGHGALPRSALRRNSDVPDRLLADALFSLRRFPSLNEVVEPPVSQLVARVGLVRVSVVVGLQALGIVGVLPDDAQARALLGLEARMHQSLTVPAPDRDPPQSRIAAGRPAESTVPHMPPPPGDHVTASLRAATARAIAEDPAGGTMRGIAADAGVTTGAVYRRYATKDDLVADTIRERIDQERTGWAGEFLAALADPGTADPAAILASALAVASTPGTPTTNEAIALMAAARSGPAAREALAERYTTAVQARGEQFSFLAAHGYFQHDDSPDALAWAIQVFPAGARLLGQTTPLPDAVGWLPAMRSLLRAL